MTARLRPCQETGRSFNSHHRARCEQSRPRTHGNSTVDCDRPISTALHRRESPVAVCVSGTRVAAPFYREYHRRIDLAIAAIKTVVSETGECSSTFMAQRIPGPINRTWDVLLGSDNGNSIRRLLNLDPLILFRRPPCGRTLQAARFGVIPAAFDDPEHSSFDGGFTVRQHGASHASGLDALQIEIVRSVRSQERRRNRLIQSLAQGLVHLLAQQARLVQQRR